MSRRQAHLETNRHKKGRAIAQPFCYLSAGRTLQSSNLFPLTELETSGLLKVDSPHKLPPQKEAPFSDVLVRDITAINDFLIGVEAEPFITPEKAENFKRVPFKKVDAA